VPRRRGLRYAERIMRWKIVLFALLVLTPLVVVADWQVLTGSSLWLVVWLGIPVVGIVMLLIGKVSKQPQVTSFGVAVVLSGMIGAVVVRQLNLSQVEVNKALGDQVAVALEKHWDANGNYPESLEKLVPEYLEEVPVPRVGLFADAPLWYMAAERQGGCVLGYQATRDLAVMRNKDKWSAVPVPW
jgi:hypothetical protein